ncbi:MAG: hypothetical protein JXR83_02575 [Deltaproteobacteria bacterium]|nr:hypothetical protein [Deltaproteobacteria bacterium]
MEGFRYRDDVVFLYGARLYSESPVLHEIYAESHRWEPWCLVGQEQRYGSYRLPGALYIPWQQRAELLARLKPLLLSGPGPGAAIRGRIEAEARQLLRLVRELRRRPARREEVERLLHLASRVLSVGVVKEALEPEEARALLTHFVPDRVAAGQVLALYQPLCLPHYTKLEARILWHAARCAAARDPRRRSAEVRACIARAAHHARFLLEPSELSTPAAMRGAFAERMASHGSTRRKLLAARRDVLQQNARARLASHLAAQELLRAAVGLGPATLLARRTFMELVRLIQWVATWEELKHILVMEAAAEVRRILQRHGLPFTATREELLLKLRTGAR